MDFIQYIWGHNLFDSDAGTSPLQLQGCTTTTLVVFHFEVMKAPGKVQRARYRAYFMTTSIVDQL